MFFLVFRAKLRDPANGRNACLQKVELTGLLFSIFLVVPSLCDGSAWLNVLNKRLFNQTNLRKQFYQFISVHSIDWSESGVLNLVICAKISGQICHSVTHIRSFLSDLFWVIQIIS